MYVTQAELREAMQGMIGQVREMLINRATMACPRCTIDAVSTTESGAQFLTDRVKLWRATDPKSKDASTSIGRLEMAGHLVIPRLREPAQVIGDASNGQYFPLASQKYRPSSGKVGDSCQYNLTDVSAQRATMWTRETGKVEIDSGFNAPAAQDVVVNHGTHKVARVADQGNPGVLRAVYAPIPMSSNVLLTVGYIDPTNPDGGPPGSFSVLFQLTLPPIVVVNVPTAPVVPNDIQMLNYNTTGADHFKG